MRECYVALGSNLDSPTNHIIKAVTELNSLPQTKVILSSSLYRSAPWGMVSQPHFINAVVKLETTLCAKNLLEQLLLLEKQHGRERQTKFGPRTLDCDLLLYQDETIDEPNLTIPHPFMTERVFVLLPLAEIAPELMIQGQSVLTWLSRCDHSQIEKLILSEEV